MRLVMKLQKPAQLWVIVLSVPFCASICTPERFLSGHSHLEYFLVSSPELHAPLSFTVFVKRIAFPSLS